MILTQIAHGLTDASIAAVNHRSETTVRTHVARLIVKLLPASKGQNPRVMLTRIAIGAGLVAVPSR